MQITLAKLRRTLKTRFGGLLKAGQHEENGECCALELLSVCRKIPWTDSPEKTGSWDLRSLNDIPVADDLRAKHLLPVIALYADALSWPKKKQVAVATKLAIFTVNRLTAELPGLTDAIRKQCREASNLKTARSAAGSAAWSAARSARSAAGSARSAAESARSAAGSARSAAESARSAAGSARSAAWSAVFVITCQLWIDAAK